MAALITALKEWVESLVIGMGYPGIIFVMALENVFPPIPSEAIMPLAGYLAATQPTKFHLLWVTVAGTIGSVVGAIVLYAFGYWADEPIVRRFLRRFGKFLFISERDLDVAIEWFTRYGDWVIFFGRLVPIIRSLISVPAGFRREGKPMPMGRFLVLTVVGTATWSFLLAYAGMILGEHWELVMGIIDRYEQVVIVVLIGLVAVFLWKRAISPLLRRRTEGKSTTTQR
jgi:membrane protein DedA with SNARE-associated domain